MKTIKPDELFQSLGDFLKGKGIELKEGPYAERIRRACNLLGDTINVTRKTARKATEEVDRKLDQVRQCIHEATAPGAPQPPLAATPPAATATATASAPEPPPPLAAARKATAPKARKAQPRRKKAASRAKAKKA